MEQLKRLRWVLCEAPQTCSTVKRPGYGLGSDLCRLSLNWSLSSPDVRLRAVYEGKRSKSMLERRKLKCLCWTTGMLQTHNTPSTNIIFCFICFWIEMDGWKDGLHVCTYELLSTFQLSSNRNQTNFNIIRARCPFPPRQTWNSAAMFNQWVHCTVFTWCTPVRVWVVQNLWAYSHLSGSM